MSRPVRRAEPGAGYGELQLSTWKVRRSSTVGTGILLVLGSPGFATLPVVGIPLALGALVCGLGLLFSFTVAMSGRCPYCEVTQTVGVPTDGLSWRRIKKRRTGRVFGADCVVCRNRMIVRVDDRVALPAPSVIRLWPSGLR